MNQPQAFTDDMLDEDSRTLMTGLIFQHTLSGANLQNTLRQSAVRLQCEIQARQFAQNRVSQFVCLSSSLTEYFQIR